MNKISLSLGLALVILLGVTGSASAQTVPGPTVAWGSASQAPRSSVLVAAKDMRLQSQAIWTSGFVDGLMSKWKVSFGWTPSAPVSVYLYRTGIAMASDVGWFRVMPLNSSELSDANGRVGFTVRDARPIGPGGGDGGWKITINVNFDNPSAQSTTPGPDSLNPLPPGALKKEAAGFLVHELASLMLQDLSGTGGISWLRAGVADLIMNSEVPGLGTTATRQAALSSAMGSGTVPGPIALTNSWTTISTGPANVSDAAYGVADQTAFFLSQRVGLPAVIGILRRTSAGEDFDMVLREVTGYSIMQLDTEVGGTLAYR